MQVPIEQLFDVSAAAGILAISSSLVRRLERDGELPGIRIAGLLRFPESSLRAFLQKAAEAPRRVPPPELLAAGGRPQRRGRRR